MSKASPDRTGCDMLIENALVPARCTLCVAFNVCDNYAKSDYVLASALAFTPTIVAS